AMPRGKRERVDNVPELEMRTWPAVREDERPFRGAAFAAHMDKVDVETFDRRCELRIGVEQRLLRAPIIPIQPVVAELPERRRIASKLPPLAVGSGIPAIVAHPLKNPIELGLWNRDAKGSDRHFEFFRGVSALTPCVRPNARRPGNSAKILST